MPTPVPWHTSNLAIYGKAVGYCAVLFGMGWLVAQVFPYGLLARRPKVWVRITWIAVSLPLALATMGLLVRLLDGGGLSPSPLSLALLYCLWIGLLLLSQLVLDRLTRKLSGLEVALQRRWERAVLAFVFALGLTTGLVVARCTALDGPGWFWAIGESRTVYARGYSDAAFKAVRMGDSEERVLQLLGPPVQKFDYPISPDFTWAYTVDRFSKSHSYRRRQVRFGRDGRVIETQSFYDLF